LRAGDDCACGDSSEPAIAPPDARPKQQNRSAGSEAKIGNGISEARRGSRAGAHCPAEARPVNERRSLRQAFKTVLTIARAPFRRCFLGTRRTTMAMTLGDAARATGAAKSTIFRAIKGGRLSATRTETGQWAIDPAELFRVFDPLAVPGATPPPAALERDATTDALVTELRQVIADLRSDRDDLRADRDHWRQAFESAQRALPVPMERGAPWWRRWRRAG
jgi:hypothetical protein